jgi:hypothetical protein
MLIIYWDQAILKLLSLYWVYPLYDPLIGTREEKVRARRQHFDYSHYQKLSDEAPASL